eukprot:TRINITY_DN3759_c0_g1_i1.p1 TRINITY_DN3759_c0_g1~~TRINITY_DN3759_c0_g1_i1.p1  ORF type:complete len:335 (+),score=61.27 TRINITY_DN3759_c0_g1_i1:88-1005(+)
MTTLIEKCVSRATEAAQSYTRNDPDGVVPIVALWAAVGVFMKVSWITILQGLFFSALVVTTGIVLWMFHAYYNDETTIKTTTRITVPVEEKEEGYAAKTSRFYSSKDPDCVVPIVLLYAAVTCSVELPVMQTLKYILVGSTAVLFLTCAVLTVAYAASVMTFPPSAVRVAQNVASLLQADSDCVLPIMGLWGAVGFAANIPWLAFLNGVLVVSLAVLVASLVWLASSYCGALSRRPMKAHFMYSYKEVEAAALPLTALVFLAVVTVVFVQSPVQLFTTSVAVLVALLICTWHQQSMLVQELLREN